MFKVIKKEGSARRGEFVPVHGTVQTPAFMNVATCGAIKGAVSALDFLTPPEGVGGKERAQWKEWIKGIQEDDNPILLLYYVRK